MNAAELVLKMVWRWSKQTSNKKAAGAANFYLMEKLQATRGELKSSKEEIAQINKLTLYKSRKGGKLDPKLEAALKETEKTWLKLQKVQEELQNIGDAKLMLEDAKLQIRESEFEIASLADALREVTKQAESNPKRRLIEYHQELLRRNTSTTSSDEASSQRRRKKASKKKKRDTCHSDFGIL